MQRPWWQAPFIVVIVLAAGGLGLAKQDQIRMLLGAAGVGEPPARKASGARPEPRQVGARGSNADDDADKRNAAPKTEPASATPRTRPEPTQPEPTAADDAEAEDQQRSEEVKAFVRQRAITNARPRVNITMYATKWCPACAAARTLLKDKGISYLERDIEENAAAKSVHKRLNPEGSVPTFDIDGIVLVGYGRVLDTIDDAAAKRVGY